MASAMKSGSALSEYLLLAFDDYVETQGNENVALFAKSAKVLMEGRWLVAHDECHVCNQRSYQ